MRKVLLSCLMVVACIAVRGQALSSYHFCAFDSTYVALPSTLSFVTPTASYGGGGYYDDDSYNSIPIGFNFVYCGTMYTTLSASANCWIALGQSLPLTGTPYTFDNDLDNLGGTSVYFSVSNFNLPRPILAPLWTDALSSSANLRYSTTGTVGSRVFTIEWVGVSFYPTTTPYENVQIKLYETSNWIDFRYQKVATGSYSGGYCGIGITGGSGATGSAGASGTQPYWSLNNASGAPTASMTVNTRNISGQPASNQVYRWLTGSLTATATNNGPLCSGSTLNLTGTVTGATGTTTYSWTGPAGFTSTLLSPSITGITTAQAGTYTFTATSNCLTATATTVVVVNATPSPITGTLSVCAGSNTTLTDVTTSGTWTSGATGVATVGSTTGIVTGVTPGTAVITYTGAGGCFVTATITVNTLPNPITGTFSECVGNTTTLNDVTGGGTWTSGTTTVATVGSSSGIVTGVAGGTSNITYTATGGCYVTAPFTVNPLPAAIAGSSTVCQGSTTTLTETSGTGTWSSSNAAVATVSSTGVVTGVAAGTLDISFTLGTGCYVTFPMTVNALPSAITGTSEVCVGSTVSLTETSTGGTWTSSSTGTATVSSSGVVTGVAAGTVTITYGSTCYVTFPLTVNPLPSAITGTSSLCLGETSTTLSDATGGGNWSSSAIGVATVAGGVITGVSVGTANITYQLPLTGCYVVQPITVNAVPTAITGADSVCVGSTTTLLETATTGTWSSGSTGTATIGATTGIVTGVSAGTAVISYTITGTGCYATFNEDVRPLPAAITGITDICPSEGTVTLSDATVGGTWTSSNTAVATIGSGSGVVSGVSAGTVTITYQLPTACYVTETFTVNPLPDPITGSTAVCVGSETTLADASGSGNWTSSNTAVATVGAATGIVTGVASGTATITFTLGTGCYVTFDITVNAIPGGITGGPFEVCQGLTLTLSDGSGGGTWTSSSTGIATVGTTNGVVTGVSAGTSTISYTFGTGCASSIVVTVNPLPAAIGGPNVVCVGQSITATEATTPGTWSSGTTGVATIGAGTGIIVGASAGATIITYTLSTGCIMTEIVTVNPLPSPIAGPTEVCPGSVISVTDATGGGSWASSSTATATVTSISTGTGGVTGVAPGTVVITYTIATGCYVTENITVNSLPNAITGALDVCELGGTTTLADATIGGTWASSNTSVATVGGTTGVVTGVVPGLVTISYTVTTTGCYVTALVNVHPLPTAIDGPTEVCVGSSVTESGMASGGSYTCTPLSVATIGLTSGILTGVSAGTVEVTYTVANNCYITKTVTVNPIPPASITALGDTVMCPGAFVILIGNTGYGLSYQWFRNGAPLAGSTASTLLATLPGAYSVFEANTFGCTHSSTPMTIAIDTPRAHITPPAVDTFCAGSGFTINANTGGGLTYQWMTTGAGIPGATLSTYTVFAAGTYIVEVTNAAGCTAADSITLFTRPSPTVDIAAEGPTSFCAGDSVILIGTPGAASYQWNVGGVPIPGATTISYTVLGTGSYALTETNLIGCPGISTAIFVNANPLPVTVIASSGPTTFCTGGNVTLSIPSSPGVTYQWFDYGAAIAGATNSNYTTSVGGSFTVQALNTITGCSGTTQIPMLVVLVDAPYVIGLTSLNFCWGSIATIGVDVVGATGTYYQWYQDGILLPGATGSTLNTIYPGTYSCQLTVSGAYGCTVMATPAVLTQYPLPNPIINWVSPNLVTQNYFVSYQWYKNLALISGANTYEYAPTGNGNYTVRVVDTDGCQSMSDVFVLTDYGTGGTYVQPHPGGNGNDIKIFPNPTTGVVHIESNMKLSATIASVDGRKLLERQDVKTIDIAGLPSGMYMLSLYDETGALVRIEKLVRAE